MLIFILPKNYHIEFWKKKPGLFEGDANVQDISIKL